MPHEIKPPLVESPMQPFAMARKSHHLFRMARGYADQPDARLARLYLYCVSIELGLKAALLDHDSTKGPDLRAISHDLVQLMDQFKNTFGFDLFGTDDVTAIKKINPYFKGKDLEYVEPAVVTSLMKGSKDMPLPTELEAAVEKVDTYLGDKGYFN